MTIKKLTETDKIFVVLDTLSKSKCQLKTKAEVREVGEDAVSDMVSCVPFEPI